MSIRHVAAVLDSDLRPNLRMVAVVYAESANSEDDIVFLSIETIEAGSGYAQRQAREITKQLRDEGVLEELPADLISERAWAILRSYRADRRPKVYRFHLGCGHRTTCKHCTPSDGDDLRSDVERDALARSNGVRGRAPKPEEEPEEEPIAWFAQQLRYEPEAGWEPTSLAHRWKTPDGFRDLIWDAVIDVCRIDPSQMTKTADDAIGLTVKELRAAGADPIEIQHRATRYRRGQGPVPEGTRLTHHALRTHRPAHGAIAGTSVAVVSEVHSHRWDEIEDPDSRGRYCVSGRHWENDSK